MSEPQSVGANSRPRQDTIQALVSGSGVCDLFPVIEFLSLCRRFLRLQLNGIPAVNLQLPGQLLSWLRRLPAQRRPRERASSGSWGKAWSAPGPVQMSRHKSLISPDWTKRPSQPQIRTSSDSLATCRTSSTTSRMVRHCLHDTFCSCFQSHGRRPRLLAAQADPVSYFTTVGK